MCKNILGCLLNYVDFHYARLTLILLQIYNKKVLYFKIFHFQNILNVEKAFTVHYSFNFIKTITSSMQYNTVYLLD